MYGYRARIGYCSPPFVTEGFCYEFHKVAPEGVTLMITALAVTSLTSAATRQQMAQSHAKSLEAAEAMARAGADVVVLGGNPINLRFRKNQPRSRPTATPYSTAFCPIRSRILSIVRSAVLRLPQCVVGKSIPVRHRFPVSQSTIDPWLDMKLARWWLI